MSRDRRFPQISTLELKLHIERRLGHQKADKYFNLMNRYLSLKVSKSDFGKLCVGLLGRENISLHNGFLRAIIKNASIFKSPSPKHEKAQASLNLKVRNGYQRSSFHSLYGDVFPQSPRKGRSSILRDHTLKVIPSPLRPHGKTHNVGHEDSTPKVVEQQSATELLSLGSRPPAEVTSVEEGEEVEQFAESPGVYSRTPLSAPLGISLNTKGLRKVHGSSSYLNAETCYNTGELPDTSSLREKLELMLETEGLNISANCVNLLNNGLDMFMKRLLQPCLDLAASRSEHKLLNNVHHQVTNRMGPLPCLLKHNSFVSVTMLDFRVAMESNPSVLGEDWPVKLEKVSLGTSEDNMDI
ncbi:uncharacterized protein LOC111367235 isoform X1 [Olea europaea subsp. europaea]|uniref:Uncharacterized protein LOC111367235 isoform X1 n=1 Tax=Olea europaea subsp. europaea TaxID=158383 RepID=A0A8S0PTW0_OLEEU|nr:uncharacterized protein LOC111367235 isoform X1 [Olea europaea subsp. europaea]